MEHKPKVRFINEKRRTDIDFTLWCVTYWNYPSIVYASYDKLPDVAKEFIAENKPTEKTENNIITKTYGNDSDYKFEDIVRGYPWENR